MSCEYRLKLLSSTATIVIASALLQAPSAQADCLPENNNPNAKIICDGAVSNSYISSVSNLEIKVSADAVMTGSPAFTLSGNSMKLINLGSIQSSSIGIDSSRDLIVENSNLISGTDFGIRSVSSNLTIENNTDGIIRGNTGVSSFYYYSGNYYITNGGRIEGTDGLAIERTYNLTLDNQETGQVIGGILYYRELDLTNAGLIDGGNNAAIKKYSYYGYNSTLENSGTIKSAINNDFAVFVPYTDVSNSGVIEATGTNGSALFVHYASVTNSGIIRTSGNGTALFMNNSSLTNEADGEIISDGIAISGYGAIITNFGSIAGNVDFASYYDYDVYRDMGGTITGDLNFGWGNDLFLYDYDLGTGLDSISGTVDPGEGLDSYGITAEGEVTISPTVPDGFERFAVEARGVDSIVTLSPIGDDTIFNNPILAMGEGTVINNTSLNITAEGAPAIALLPAQDVSDPSVSLINNAAITTHGNYVTAISGEQNNKIQNNSTLITNGNNATAIQASRAMSVVNTGNISTSGENSFGAYIRYYLYNPERTQLFDNSGSILTSGNNAHGLLLYGGGVFTNSGDIQTSGFGAAGAYLEGGHNGYLEFNNTGTITSSGQEASGLIFRNNSIITNSGKIESTQYSAIKGYSYSYNSRLVNTANGTIIGGNGIAIEGSNAHYFTLDNAGLITGDIVFNESNYYSCRKQDVLNSGTIEGPVLLGGCDDTFNHNGGTVSGVVDLGDENDHFILNLDTGAKLSDIAGGVIAGEGIDTFSYSSGQETTINLTPVAGFEIFGVIAEGSDANITLNTSADHLTEYLTVSGEGTVTNNISFKRDLEDNNYYYNPAIIRIKSEATFINKADIELGSIGSGSKSAVYLDTGSNYNNQGSITASADDAVGITSFGRTFNSGTVTTGTGPAVILYGFLENSGSVFSQGQAINITHDGYYDNATVHNKSSGIIEGQNGQAIIGSGYYYSQKSADISNAGQIIGDVTLGRNNDSYFANGGFLDGNLNLGDGNDILFVDAANVGTDFLSGTVDGGYGWDSYGLVYREDSEASLIQKAGFEGFAIGIIGTDTRVTLKETGQTTSAAISVAGNGTLINEMDIGTGYSFDLKSSGLNFINKANISGINSNAREINITNEGHITTTSNNHGIYLSNAAGSHVTNTGTIESFGYNNVLVYMRNTNGYYAGSGILLDGAEHNVSENQITSFRNEGILTGGAVVMEYFDHIKFENTGQINSRYRALSLNGASIDAANSGTLSTNAVNAITVYITQSNSDSDDTLVFLNEGEILASGLQSNAINVYSNENLTLTNRGIIKTTGGPSISNGINYQGNAYQNYYTNAAVLYRNGVLINDQGGIIEVTKFGTVAVEMVNNSQDVAVLENAGSIIATDGVEYTDYYGYMHFIAGAIRGNDNQQTIRNSGLIKGSVDLGGGDDTFEMHEGGIMDGQVDGGLGDDHILLNYTTDIAIDGMHYKNFETLEKTGSGNFNLTNILDIAEVTITEGILSGTGTITGNVINKGTIAPGNSPGTLTILGNLTMTEGSSLAIEAGDNLNVLGDATLTGSILQLTGDITEIDGEFLNVTGSIDGQFNSITLPDNNSSLFKHVSLAYGDGTATLIMEDQFAAIDASLKNSAEGRYISDLMANDLSPETYGALRSLSALNSTQLANAISQITGESYAAATQIGLISGQTMIESNRNRFSQHLGAKGVRLWVEGIGSFNQQNGNSGHSAHKTNLYGTLAGLDYGLSEQAMIGVTLGYVDGRQTLNGMNASNDYKAHQFGLNGIYHLNQLRFGAAVSYSSGDVDTKRSFQSGVINGLAQASYDLNTVMTQGEVGYDLGLDNVTIEPRVGISWTSVTRKNTQENGLSGLNLSIDEYKQKIVTSFAGVHLAKSFTTEGGTIFEPELNIGWDYDLKQDGLLAVSQFAGNNGAHQSHYAATSGKSRIMIGAGLTTSLTNGITLFARYSGRYNGQEKRHQANLGLGVSF